MVNMWSWPGFAIVIGFAALIAGWFEDNIPARIVGIVLIIIGACTIPEDKR